MTFFFASAHHNRRCTALIAERVTRFYGRFELRRICVCRTPLPGYTSYLKRAALRLSQQMLRAWLSLLS